MSQDLSLNVSANTTNAQASIALAKQRHAPPAPVRAEMTDDEHAALFDAVIFGRVH